MTDNLLLRCLDLSTLFLLLTPPLALWVRFRKRKGGIALRPMPVLLGGIYLSAVVLLFGIYYMDPDWFACNPSPMRGLQSTVAAIYNAFRLFSFGGDFKLISQTALELPAHSGRFTAVALLLYGLAPLLSLGFVLSFLTNSFNRLRLKLSFWRNLYIFSELNECSIYLAERIMEQATSFPNPLIVFTGLAPQNGHTDQHLLHRAKQLRACCLSQSIQQVKLSSPFWYREVRFFAIGNREEDNVHTGLELIRRYGQRTFTWLHVVTTSPAAEAVLHSALRSEKGGSTGMEVRCINEARSLVYHLLYNMAVHGPDLFQTAVTAPDGIKEISAVVLGLGQQGTEMVKALSWFCQMIGYRVVIHAFDQKPQALADFTAQCPELVTHREEREGDARCTVHIHPGVNVNSLVFTQEIAQLSHISYLFVALGNDNANIQAAMTCRRLSRRQGLSPIIQAVVWNPQGCAAMAEVTNHKGHPYDIHCVGHLGERYSTETFLNSRLEGLAFLLHTAFYGASADSFWGYEYNYRSSVASVLHHYARKACGMVENSPQLHAYCQAQGLSPADGIDLLLPRLEHCRWNAYMRSEGYRPGQLRDDMAKLHPSLKNWTQLSKKEQEKDRIVLQMDRFIRENSIDP